MTEKSSHEDVGLQISEEIKRSEGLLAAIGDGLSIQNTDFKILYQNEIHQGLIGSHVGEYCYRAYEQRDSVCEGCPVNLTFMDGGIHTSARTTTVDGHTSFVEITTSPLRDKNGKIIAAIEIVRDISRRKAAEEEAKKSKAYLDRIINGMSDSLLIINRDYTIQDVNARFIELHKNSRAELIGKHCFAILHNQSQPCDGDQPCPLRMVVRSKLPVVVEHNHRDNDGDKHIVELYCFPLFDAEGEVEQVVEVMQDITARKLVEAEQKRLQAQLRHAQKMEAIGTLAGGIAHDFNNILVPIFGNTDIAKSYLPEGSPAHDLLDAVLKSANRAKDLVRQILTFAKMSEQEFGPVQIRFIIKDGLKLLRSTIPSSVEIIENIDPATGVVFADPTQLHQVLMNLCMNAYQAMNDAKGTIGIGLERVLVAENELVGWPDPKPGTYARLSISDNGHGIDSTILEHIFDPYFTTKGMDEGTGLGLAVVLGIVKNHKGFVTIDSELGRGTVFNVYFPSSDYEPNFTDETVKEIPTGTERILFVDDEADVLHVWEYILSELGYTVTTKTNSFEALKLFKAHPTDFDLVITDQAMPGMPGLELAGALMDICPDLPIILCTGYSSIINDEKFKKFGFREFLQKPFETHEIASKIRWVLDKKETLGSKT